MSRSDDELRRIDALVAVAMRLAVSAPSGRIALAKLASALEPEWIPPRWRDTLWPELEAARAAASEPIPFDAVERILRGAWGGKPSDELDGLEREPVAVTPTSQVHRGELDGAPVAVKVLRPGLSGSVRQDLTLLEGLLSPLGSAFPALDTQGIVRELRERVLDEFDLEHEAQNQRRFHRALRRHPFLSVPAPVTRLAGDSVLVSEWVDGTPLRDAPDPDLAAARLLVFVLGGMRAGLMHADADPEDVLVAPDGSLSVVDFGAVATVEPARADIATRLVRAFAQRSAPAFGDALSDLGLLDAAHGPSALELTVEALGELGEEAPSRLDARAVLQAGRRLARRGGDGLELLLAGSLPPEELMSSRAVALVYGTIARVGATAPWRELTLAALEQGWEATA